LGAPLEEEPGLAAGGFPSREQLVGIADLHRGEQVLVLTAGPAREADAYASTVRVEVGSDGGVVVDSPDEARGSRAGTARRRTSPRRALPPATVHVAARAHSPHPRSGSHRRSISEGNPTRAGASRAAATRTTDPTRPRARTRG